MRRWRRSVANRVRTSGDGRPVRVMLVQHYADGGSLASLLELARGLDRDRFEPIVCCRNRNPYLADFEASGIPVVVLDDRPLGPAAAPSPADAPALPVKRSSAVRRELRRFLRNDLKMVRPMLAAARAHRVDLVHANNDVLSNRYALVAARRLGLPVVVHVRSLFEYQPGPSQVIDRVLVRCVDRFICISRSVAEHYVAQLPIRSDRLSVIDNPFDTAAYAGGDPSGVAVDLGLAADAEVVLLMGRLARWKGQDLFLRAIAPVLHGRTRTVAVLVGAPLGREGDEFVGELKALAAELGIADRVIFAGRRSDLADTLALADVVVHCSTSPEPFGRVIVEAMAAARPVIGARAGGVIEIIEDERTGLLVDPGDAGALGAAIGSLLEDPDRAAALGLRAQAAVVERYGVERHARAVEAVYDQALSRR